MDHFEQFWKLYPVGRRIGKDKMRLKFERITKTVDACVLLESLENHIAIEWRGVANKFIPHMATWLNQQRWTKEFTTTAVNYDQKSVVAF